MDIEPLLKNLREDPWHIGEHTVINKKRGYELWVAMDGPEFYPCKMKVLSFRQKLQVKKAIKEMIIRVLCVDDQDT